MKAAWRTALGRRIQIGRRSHNEPSLRRLSRVARAPLHLGRLALPAASQGDTVVIVAGPAWTLEL